MVNSERKKQALEESNDILVRISGQDIPGSKNLYSGLARIKGVSWSVSNFLCHSLKLKKSDNVSSLSKDQIKEIENFLKNLQSPNYLKNRNRDIDSGESKHLVSVDLDMRKDFDIKRLKQINSYRGIRHSFKLPVRGQRTRSNFRKSGIAVGVKKPKLGKKS